MIEKYVIDNLNIYGNTIDRIPFNELDEYKRQLEFMIKKEVIIIKNEIQEASYYEKTSNIPKKFDRMSYLIEVVGWIN